MVIPRLLSRSLIPLLLLPMAIACREPVAQTETDTQLAVSDAPSLNVVATFLPMYWFTRAVTGDSAQVQVLIPPGSDVHEYQARPADVQAIATANILVKNGIGLEEFLENTITNANNPNLQEINASAGIQPLDDNTPVVKAVDSNHDHDLIMTIIMMTDIIMIMPKVILMFGLIPYSLNNKSPPFEIV